MSPKAFAFVPVTFVTALLSIGCANGKSNFFANDGGLEGGAGDGGAKSDGGTAAAPACADFCSTAGSNGTGCDDSTKCESLCKADNKAANNNACTDERNALLTCAVGPKGSITCSSTKIDITGCSSQKKAFDACMGDTTTTDAGTNPGTCSLKQDVSSTPACNTCVNKSCCNEWNACFDSTDCNAFGNCLSACTQGDTTCENGCVSSHSSGAALFDTASQCAQTSCATPCGF